MPFSNPIVAGDTLIRAAVRSENYVPDTDGWSIERDGYAEFNELSVRGTIDVTNPDDPTDRIEILLINDRPFIRWAFNGLRYVAFVSESAGINQFILGSEVSPGSTDFRIWNNPGGPDVISMGTFAGHTLINEDGFLRYNRNSSDFVALDWQNATPAGGWTGGAGIQYKLLPTGEVVFRGNCSGGTNTVGTPIIQQLPAAYRPAAGTPGNGGRWWCTSGTGTGGGTIQIDTSGNVVIGQTSSGVPPSFWVAPIRYSVI